MLIAGKTITQRVLDKCEKAAQHVLRKIPGAECTVALLTPTGDPLAAQYSGRVPVFEGPENDVLGRYERAIKELSPDYLVRITGDCPMLCVSTLFHVIVASHRGKLDYCSNVDERCRTSLDGHDVEVVSKSLFDLLASEAKTQTDREHVTTWIRRAMPKGFRFGAIFCDDDDFSSIKTSIDTAEDLARVEKALLDVEEKKKIARRCGYTVLEA